MDGALLSTSLPYQGLEMEMNIKTNVPTAQTFRNAVQALENSGLSQFASILREQEHSTPARTASVASQINTRLTRLADDNCEHPASAALSSLIREIYL